MFKFLLLDAYLPFSIALTLVLILTLIEIIALIFGISTSHDSEASIDVDVPDLDIDLDLGDMDLDIDTPDFDAEIDVDSDIDADASAAQSGQASHTTILGWLGFGKVPLLVFLMLLLTSFGLAGIIIQQISFKVLNLLLSAWIASVPALLIAFYSTSKLSNLIQKIIPKSESTAILHRSLGGRLADVTGAQGRKGRPTEAKITDGYGQVHYILVEPDDEDAFLDQGEKIFILRDRPVNNIFRGIKLKDQSPQQ